MALKVVSCSVFILTSFPLRIRCIAIGVSACLPVLSQTTCTVNKCQENVIQGLGLGLGLVDVDVDVDGVYERRPKPLCPHLEITSR